MTIDEEATYRTIDCLQMTEDYDSIREIIEYATAALVNDGENAEHQALCQASPECSCSAPDCSSKKS